ncbi:MAG: right-handed parallel beta-helix repeat-containing protein, partial [Patescibacteria group bacterium]|nr:right-handed parallel beta-helix repeat-containing protein [Patescibacteria group bacterium]
MRKILLILALLLAASPAWGISKYLRSGQTAADSTGADWASAYNSHIKAKSELVRGDTLWVAGGYYPGKVTWDTAVGGTTLITVLYAQDGDSTWDDHGTNTGWDPSYDDISAFFIGAGGNTTAPFVVGSNYWLFDGRKGAGYDSTAYGFKVSLSDTAANTEVVQIFRNVDNVTLKYFDIDGFDEGEDGVYKPSIVCLYVYPQMASEDGCQNITVSNCYLHDVSGVHIQYAGAINGVVENCYFEKRIGGNLVGGGYIHGESIAIQGGMLTADNHIRNNHFRNVSGTGFIVFTNADASGYHFYGNTFEQTSATYNVS